MPPETTGFVPESADGLIAAVAGATIVGYAGISISGGDK
jgi:hypothetical protein